MTTQIAIVADLRPEEVAREKSMGGAIELCAKAAGFALDKDLQQQLGVDKAQFSRWHSGAEGVVWPKFERLMDICGNDAPLLWMLHQRGYDLHSLRKRESETQKQLRIEQEKLKEAEKENALLRSLLGGRRDLG